MLVQFDYTFPLDEQLAYDNWNHVQEGRNPYVDDSKDQQNYISNPTETDNYEMNNYDAYPGQYDAVPGGYYGQSYDNYGNFAEDSKNFELPDPEALIGKLIF